MRKLGKPELLELRAAPGGTLGGMMLGAVWFGSDEDDDAERPARYAYSDPVHDLSYAAYLKGQTNSGLAAASGAKPDLLMDQFHVGFTRWSERGQEPVSPTESQLATARILTKDVIAHAVDKLSRGSITEYDWIDQLPIFEDLATAFASHDMEVMRAGFVPRGMNPGTLGQGGFEGGAATGGGSVSPADAAPITSRPHGDITPLRLSPPQPIGDVSVGSGMDLPMITTMSGGSGGGSPPVAADDFYSGLHDETINVPDDGVFWNDFHSGCWFDTVSSPAYGTLSNVSPGGGFTYGPPANWKGTDSFTYKIADAYGTSNEAIVWIDILNTVPATGADTYSAITNTELVIPSSEWPGVGGLLANDSDGDGDDISIWSISPPQNGSIDVASDGSFTYMPNTDYEGPDDFSYRITDGVDESSDQWVTLNVWKPLVDLDTDSDNDGTIEGSVAEDLIEMAFPGKIIERNSDDDNVNLIRDFEEAPMTMWGMPFEEFDLFEMNVAVETPIPASLGFQFQFDFFGNGLAVWSDRYKQDEITDLDAFTIGTDQIPTQLFVEGCFEGSVAVTGTLRNTAGVTVNTDSVVFQVVEMDIDTDSDNTTEVNGTVMEDLLENRPGNGVMEVGARIFANRDDDNENGKVDEDDENDDYIIEDKDFATVKLDAPGGFEGYTVWLGVDSGLKVWGDKKKELLSDHDKPPFDWINRPEGPNYVEANDTWYGWTLGEGPAGAHHPAELFIEGLELPGLASHCENVQWLLMKPGVNHSNLFSSSKLAEDIVEINVEKIVWPSRDQLNVPPNVDWEDQPTSEWEGIELPNTYYPENAGVDEWTDAWYISNALVDFIVTPNNKGNIQTIHPDYDNGTKATQDGSDAPTTSTYGGFSNGFTMEIDYSFEMRGNDYGWVQAVKNGVPLSKLSFVGNSGIKFGGTEAAILDVTSMIAEGGGENAFAPPNGYIQSSGDVDTGGTYQTEGLNTLMTGIRYDGSFPSMQDFIDSNPDDPPTASDYFQTLLINKGHANGHMKVSVEKTGSTFTVSIFLDNSSTPTYSQTGVTLTALNEFLIQSHWGSGVEFENLVITKHS